MTERKTNSSLEFYRDEILSWYDQGFRNVQIVTKLKEDHNVTISNQTVGVFLKRYNRGKGKPSQPTQTALTESATIIRGSAYPPAQESSKEDEDVFLPKKKDDNPFKKMGVQNPTPGKSAK